MAAQSPSINLPFLYNTDAFDAIFKLSGFGNSVEQFYENLQCIGHVISEVVAETDLQPVWENGKNALAKANEDWKKCNEVSNILSRQK